MKWVANICYKIVFYVPGEYNTVEAVWTGIAWAWNWIGKNQGQLTILTTLAGVLVAWRYVVLTRRLAETASVQVGAAKEQAEAARNAAVAAADQARTTRLIFQAQRPVLRVETRHEFVAGATPQAHDHLFTFSLQNLGTVLAEVDQWGLTIRKGDQAILETHKQGAEVGVSTVAPGVSSHAVPALSERIPNQFRGSREPLAVEAKVSYRGVEGAPYSSWIRAVLTVSPEAVRYTVTDEG